MIIVGVWVTRKTNKRPPPAQGSCPPPAQAGCHTPHFAQSLTLFSCVSGGEHLLSFSVQFLLYMPLFYAKNHVMQGIQLIID